MPVPVFGRRHPSGQVPPAPDLSGVTELRVHGVGGTTPGALLGDLAPQQVAGDAVAGFYRTDDLAAGITADRAGRHVEAYSWGGLTSRSGTRVLWLLLLPFLLANLAGWMCSPRARRSPLHRWAVRLGALGITLNGLVVTAMATVDVLGYQCGTDPSCRGRHWWLLPLRWIAGRPGRQILIGALVPTLVLVLLGVLSYRSRRRYEAVRPTGIGMPGPRSGRSAASLPGGLADAAFWDGDRATKRLGRAHVAASLAVLTVLVLHAAGLVVPLGPLSGPVQVLALVVLAGAVVLLAFETVTDRWGAWLQGIAVAGGLVAAMLLWIAPGASAVPDGQLPGIREVVNGMYGLLFGFLALVLICVLAYGREAGSFRWGAPFVLLAVAVALLNAVLLGLLVGVAELAGSVQWQIGPGPAGSVSVFPVVQAATPYLTLLPVGLLIVFALVEGWLYWRAGRRGVASIEAEYAALTEPVLDGPRAVWVETGGPAWYRRIARARRLAVAGTDVSYLLTAIAVAGVVVMVVAEWVIWLRGSTPAPGSRLTAIGTTFAVALPLALMAALRSGWRSLAGRRRIGVLWDVGTFWPRAFHPLAPPSYAERAVPDLQRRLWWLHDNGGRVLIAAHSQGTVLAAAALLQQSARAPGSAVGLVTFGSPLGKLYRWGFPAWVDDGVLAGLAGPDTTWINIYYATDYIGGPVFADATAGIDRRLPDPRTSHYLYGQPLPPIGAHSGYWTDPGVWSVVDDLAATLAVPPPVVPPPVVPPSVAPPSVAPRPVAPPVSGSDGA
ncbi:MAG TPA: hypothetical protein VI357_15900 [Mycobacteriales bacterium]